MKKAFTLLAVVMVLFSSVSGQKKLLRVNENKYRIELPDFWAHGNKVWKVLSDKLPLVCGELKDKELCGDDCNPKYIVELVYSEPVIYDYSSYLIPQSGPTNTRAMVKPLATGAYITYPELNTRPLYSPVYQRESYKITTEYGFQCFLLLKNDSGRILTKMVLVDTNEVWERIHQPVYLDKINSNPDAYIEKHKEWLIPEKYELLGIIDKKILALQQ